jgi:hypothetical protein
MGNIQLQVVNETPGIHKPVRMDKHVSEYTIDVPGSNNAALSIIFQRLSFFAGLMTTFSGLGRKR